MHGLQQQARPLIGVVHLQPLPGAPRPGPGLLGVVDRARRDALALAQGGAAALIVENLGDAPYERGPVEPHVLTMMTVIAQAVRAEVGDSLVLGINVLRNDGMGAIGVAAASGASFVRINVHIGAMVTDQGLIEGEARRTLLYRQRVAPGVGLACDVLVKHATPVGRVDVAQVARDTAYRGGADVLIVSGLGTGRPTEPVDLRAVRTAVPDRAVWLGSGLSISNAADYIGLIDGAIVGTALHRDGELEAPLDPERVRRMVEVLHGLG